MAAVSLSPAPVRLGDMTGRRVPLSNVPNAANSPFRAVAAAASKRSREQLEAQEDLSHEYQPHPKRQALQEARTNLRVSPRKQALQSAEGRIFNRRTANATPTAFERKLLAARGERSQQQVERQEKASNEALDTVRQWQRHYKKSFPGFVFYFESVPEDIRVRCSRWVRSLGAREEKFFSKEVTHVVTSRPIPLDNDSRDATDLVTLSSTSTSLQSIAQPRTINPSLLDRQQESFQSKSRFTFEAPVSKKIQPSGIHDVDPRKSNASNTDILHRAKEMGMKIWHLEKLQRIMNTMSNIPNDTQTFAGNNTRSRAANAAGKGDREADLSHMLRNERLNGPSDRDTTIALSELMPFKGSYIYIRDIDEKSKPIMVRDYARPGPDEPGEWPQFHSVGLGKCPFVEDSASRAEHLAREEARRAKESAASREAPRTRAATIREVAEAESARSVPQRRPLEETRDAGNAPAPPSAVMPFTAFCPPPPATTARPGSPARVTRDAIIPPRPKLFGGEPAASGMQPSNITSAIRSQMISSTAAQPGAKAGTSREVHGLKRKVLEKNSGPALISIHTRQKSIESAGNGRAERSVPAARQTRRQAQETLIHIDEESTQSEEAEDVWIAEDVRSRRHQQRKIFEKKDPKPGYCENCREKYDDFDDHIIGRKHRKFALTPENWKDLDQLLRQLGRRLKESDSDGF